MNPTDFQSVLSAVLREQEQRNTAVLREQEQRFVQLLDALRVGHSTSTIVHASCSLKPAEQNYSQIEKEGLALIFAIKKFHKYIYGRHFTLLTDHRLLLSIFGIRKGIPVHSAYRLQRWAATLLGYDFSTETRNQRILVRPTHSLV